MDDHCTRKRDDTLDETGHLPRRREEIDVDFLQIIKDIAIQRVYPSSIFLEETWKMRIKWSLLLNRSEEMLIAGDDCRGLAMDNRGYLYVSDGMRNEIRRYRIGERIGNVEASKKGK